MEKKNRPQLSTGRSAIEIKKIQDPTSNKHRPRHFRREISGSSSSSKVDQTTKKQHAKSSVKQPRPRCPYYESNTARAEAASLDLPNERLDNLTSRNKKENLNHLLNFSYAKYSPRYGLGSTNVCSVIKKPKFNKECFLQANCQFVVNHKGDYRQYINNPDSLVDWNLIEQVNVQVTEVSSCPICLYPPVAAKITRCGHIYCWSCILHYLALSDNAWRKCPICYDNIQKTDLKSVTFSSHGTFNVNDVITFNLMKRLRGSLIAYPAYLNINNFSESMLNMSQNNVKEIYSKLILADNTNILSIIERESNELKCSMLEDENAPEKCFIEEALTKLKDREDMVFRNLDNFSKHGERFDAHNLELSHERTNDGFDLEKFRDLKLNTCTNSQTLNRLEIDSPPAKYHYFYQASDGQHIYLHGVNAKMLEHTYGSLEFAPTTITGKILEKEGFSMSEDLRKRLRYLQHLPITCQFEVTEISLTTPIVNNDTLLYFEEQLAIRKKKRHNKAKNERKHGLNIEADKNGSMGKIPEVTEIHLESHTQFPNFEEAKEHSKIESAITNASDNSFNSDVTQEAACHSKVSFAKMLATEKKYQLELPQPKQNSSIETRSHLQQSAVTGAVRKTKLSSKTCDNYFTETEVEDYESVPDFHSTFAESIAETLNRTSAPDTTKVISSGSKKKKKNKRVLFMTNMAYKEN